MFNITQLTFVTKVSPINQYGNIVCTLPYYAMVTAIDLRPFPLSGDTYKYRRYDQSSLDTITNGIIPYVPYTVYDYTAPKVPVYLLY